MLKNTSLVMLSDDMAAYLEYEAQRRKITVKEVYEEEQAAAMRNQARNVDAETLEHIARDSNPDPRRLAEGERYPF